MLLLSAPSSFGGILFFYMSSLVSFPHQSVACVKTSASTASRLQDTPALDWGIRGTFVTMAPAVEYTHTQASRAFLSTVCFVRVDKGEESYVGEESYIHNPYTYTNFVTITLFFVCLSHIVETNPIESLVPFNVDACACLPTSLHLVTGVYRPRCS